MAEQVQAALDQMVAPLADLHDRNIFSQEEIHAIVARRRESEYLLKRRTPRKADFLKYIQDELQLEQLRQLRTKKQQAVERERLAKLGRLEEYYNNSKNQKHLGDAHIVIHIHLLFRRTLRKYNKEDVSIYLQYADVCKQLQSWNKLPQVYAEAVQIHPHCTGLWIEAASHEFFHRQSVSSARIMLQRALRINKTAKDLWWQSFALEFHHIAKMKGRQKILHNGTSNNNTPAEEEEDLESPLFAVAKIVYDNAIQAIPNDVSFRLRFLDLCRTFPYTENMEAYIYKSIRRDFKDTPEAWIARAARLLEQQQKQNQQQTTETDESEPPKGFTIAPEESSSEEEGESGGDEEQDASDSSNDSDSDSDDSAGMEKDAERPTKKQRTSSQDADDKEKRSDKEIASLLNAIIQNDPVLAMIQKATEAVATSEMILEATQFLWSYWEKVDDVFDDSVVVAKTRKNIIIFMQRLLEGASLTNKKGVYSDAVVLEHAEFFSRVGQLDEAQSVLSNFINHVLKKSTVSSPETKNMTRVWLKLANISSQVQSAQVARAVLKRALKHTSISKPDYLKILLELLGAELSIANDVENANEPSEEVTKALQELLLLGSNGPSAETIQASSDEDANEVSTFGVTTIARACLYFLMHCIDTLGPIKGTRNACKLILFQSNFLESQSAQSVEDVESVVALLDKCIEMETSNLKKAARNGGKSELKKDRLRLRQLFETAIRFFKDVPSLSAKYQQGRNDASLL